MHTSSVCIHTSDSEDFVRSFSGLFSWRNCLLFPPSEASTRPRVHPPEQEYADSSFFFHLLTTAFLITYVMYCIYACSPFTKGEKEPAQVLVIRNKHNLKPIHRPQKVKLNYLENSFRRNGDYNCFILFSEAAFYS